MEAYETLGILGEGTYGVVVKARSRVTGKLVAIKRFKQTEQDDHVRKTSTREVRMLQLLRHPNVIRLEDVFRREGKLYLVFEYIDHTILQLLEKTSRGLSHRELRRFTYQLLRGIEFCHKHNVIHRDVKPENVLIDESGMLKLCDFGFARQMSAKGKYTDYVATRWYRAPELLVGDVAYGKPVDVWALGCMFAELSDGQPLFPGESDLDQLCLILQTCGPVPTRMVTIFEHNPLYNGISFPHTGILYTLKERYHRESEDWLEFLSACLHPDPAQRLTCTQLMELPYFNRDGFRERYETELRAITGLPQLRTPPATSAPTPTRLRLSEQALAVAASLKADTVPSPGSRRVSEALPAPNQSLHPHNIVNVQLSKPGLDAAGHDAGAAKAKLGGGGPSPAQSPKHGQGPATTTSGTEAAAVQLPMILSNNVGTNSHADRLLVAATTDHVYPATTASGPAPQVGAGYANIDLHGYSSELDLNPGQHISPTKEKRKKRNGGSGLDTDPTGAAQPHRSSRNDSAKHRAGHTVGSATLPRSGAHELGRQSTPAEFVEAQRRTSLRDASSDGLAAVAAPLGDGGEAAVPVGRTSVDSSLLLKGGGGVGRIPPLAERLPDLSSPSLQLPRPVAQDALQPHSPASPSVSSSSTTRARGRNPLSTVPPPSHGAAALGKPGSDPSGVGSMAPMKGRRGPTNSSESSLAAAAHHTSEAKRRKLAKRKKDVGSKPERGVGPGGNSASRRAVAAGVAETGSACGSSRVSMTSLSKTGVSPSLSHVLEQQQQQHLAVGPALADAHGHGVSDLNHHRNIDAHGSLPRKERRSKPLAGSSPTVQGGGRGGEAKGRLAHPLDAPLAPDGAGVSQRATATLMALSALRGIAAPAKDAAAGAPGETEKYNYAHHTRTTAAAVGVAGHSGGESVTPAGVDGDTSKTSRARKPLGVYTLQSNRRAAEELETGRRVQGRSPSLPTGRTHLGVAVPVEPTEKYAALGSHHATGSTSGTPYVPMRRASKGEPGAVAVVGAAHPPLQGPAPRQAVRKPKRKANEMRCSSVVGGSTPRGTA